MYWIVDIEFDGGGFYGRTWVKSFKQAHLEVQYMNSLGHKAKIRYHKPKNVKN
jgi:hypothetical protein